jgi:hypothetical protein
MSSTEQDLDIDALFDELLLTAASEGTPEPFPDAPYQALKSYFLRRNRPEMRRDDFTASSCIGFEDFEQRLGAYWRAAGRPELAALAPRFAQAARSIYAPTAEDAEVSPFIYVMF